MTGTEPFDFQARTRIIYGAGCVDRVGELPGEWSGRRALVVTDPGIVAAGHVERVEKSLGGAGITAVRFDGVVENPTTREVENCTRIAREAGIDTIIGLGGGSSMDTAKGCNFLLTNGGRMQDYWGVGKACRPMLPMIAIPTTAGTGSECQSFALISDEITHQKMACGDPKAAPRVALLDPVLTLTQPKRVTACTGIDTLVHALETAVTTRRNGVSAIFSRESFRLAMESFPVVLESPRDVQARGKMQLAAALAGLAIENSMLGAAHAAANPLTAHYGIVHGEAVGLMMTPVLVFNCNGAEAVRELYYELGVNAGLFDRRMKLLDGVGWIGQQIMDLVGQAGLRTGLKECGVPRSDLPMLAEEAARQWTAQFNPCPITATDFLNLYEQCW